MSPVPAPAPVQVPDDPIVHAKVLGTLDVKGIFVPNPLHILFVAALVTAGFGFTVTTIEKGTPTHKPVVDVGLTLYSTVPGR